jgi:nucleoside 2-deoxyribosyltransferase
MGVLHKTRCYLVGHMQYAEPGDWRQQVKEKLKDTNIIFYDPLEQPFISHINENANTRDFLNKKLQEGNFDYVYKHMSCIRRSDLNLVDRCDFVLAHIVPHVGSWGTTEEIACANRMKKPVFVSIEGGRHKVPLWLAGMLPPHYFFDNVKKVVDTIREIDDSKRALDPDRWRLLKKEYR